MDAPKTAVRYDDYYPMEFPRFGLTADDDVAVARAGFELFMAQKKERITKLSILFRINNVPFGKSDEELSAMNQFVYDNLSSHADFPNQIEGVWVECALDLTAYLGEIIIERCPNVEWAVFDDRDQDDMDYLEIGLRNIHNRKLYYPLFSSILGALKQNFHSKVHEPKMRTSFFYGLVGNWSNKLCG